MTTEEALVHSLQKGVTVGQYTQQAYEDVIALMFLSYGEALNPMALGPEARRILHEFSVRAKLPEDADASPAIESYLKAHPIPTALNQRIRDWLQELTLAGAEAQSFAKFTGVSLNHRPTRPPSDTNPKIQVLPELQFRFGAPASAETDKTAPRVRARATPIV